MSHVARPGLTDVKHTMMLRDVTCNFIIAGRDTTACTLTWCGTPSCYGDSLRCGQPRQTALRRQQTLRRVGIAPW
jgi:hypothetical protein